MKYWRGYLAAAIFGVFTWVLIQMGQRYTHLMDMVYPYVTRSVQTMLTAWTSSVSFLVWQTVAVFLLIALIAVLVLVVIFKLRFVRWLGWAAAVVAMVLCLYTGLYGLNAYSGPIEDDLRMDLVDYTQTELEAATIFYRDQANALAGKIARDGNGASLYSDFSVLAGQTGNGYLKLARERSFSIFGGDYTPVKELGWAGLYSALGQSGITMALTGESAVNPNIPDHGLPFAMAHEIAHRLCIARNDEADFAAFLGCTANDSVEYQYSGYFMAYRACVYALESVDADAAAAVAVGCNSYLTADLADYEDFFREKRDAVMTGLVTTVTDSYEEATTEPDARYSSLCDYLVNWHIEEYTEPEMVQSKFDPFDETQVDLTGIVNYKGAE